MLSCAGTWDEWHDNKTRKPAKAGTIIVTATSEFTRQIHGRMPAAPEEFEPWLAGRAGIEVLKPAPEAMLQMWPVSRRVNRVRNDSDPKLIDAI